MGGGGVNVLGKGAETFEENFQTYAQVLKRLQVFCQLLLIKKYLLEPRQAINQAMFLCFMKKLHHLFSEHYLKLK